MTDECKKIQYLSIEELLIILYKNQITGLIFPKEITDTEVDGRRLKLAMDALIRDKILEPNDEDGFQFAGEARGWVDTLRQAQESVIINCRSGNWALKYIYVGNGNNAVVLQMDEHHDGWIRIECSSIKDLVSRFGDIKLPMMVEKYHRGEESPYECSKEWKYGIG